MDKREIMMQAIRNKMEEYNREKLANIPENTKEELKILYQALAYYQRLFAILFILVALIIFYLTFPYIFSLATRISNSVWPANIAGRADEITVLTAYVAAGIWIGRKLKKLFLKL